MAEIVHVVVLMLENRSFDSILGRLYPRSSDFEGLSGQEVNFWNGQEYSVWTSREMTVEAACIPTPDPNESFADMTQQIYGVDNGPPSPATMNGFVANYMQTASNDPRAVMHGFSPERLPVLSTLARSFGVSDLWHASAPNQTWPNRFFLHTGTADGYVNNSPPQFPYLMETIFNLLTRNQRSWRIYHHDFPQTATLARLWSELPDHLYSFEEDFLSDASAGRLPNYSFIEPRYFSDPISRSMPNDQHPPHNVAYGERLVARCYDALRNGPGWKNTLFVILYDEHGGIYDHVPPPAAVPPDNLQPDGFAFDRYGVRVPAVIVSPWVPAGSIIRPPHGCLCPFDHTSIIATLRDLYGLNATLTQRDAQAPTFLHALSLPSPSNEGPRDIALPTINPTDEELHAAHQSPPNALQQSLAQLAANLPKGAANIPAHTNNLTNGVIQVSNLTFNTVEDALACAKEGLERFLS